MSKKKNNEERAMEDLSEATKKICRARTYAREEHDDQLVWQVGARREGQANSQR